ncbi:MAG: hypothetical protein ACLP3K_12575 [Candidatus Acidiferrales bacterium]
MDLLAGYFDVIKRISPDNEGSQVILRVIKWVGEGRCFLGMIETGEYGVESILVDRKSKKDVYRRTQDVADMWPFFFQFYIPHGTDEGVLILQRRGNYGIRHILYELLASMVEKQFGDLRLRISPLVLEKELKRLLRGRATQVRYCRYNRSSDVADVAAGGHEESYGTMELIFKAKRGRYFDLSEKLKEILGGEPANEVFELEDMDFGFSKVKVHLEQHGRPRQVDLSNLKNVRSYRDITDRLEALGKSHSDFDALGELAADLLRETRKQMYGKADAP